MIPASFRSIASSSLKAEIHPSSKSKTRAWTCNLDSYECKSGERQSADGAIRVRIARRSRGPPTSKITIYFLRDTSTGTIAAAHA